MIGPVRIIGTQEYVAESYQLGVGVFIKKWTMQIELWDELLKLPLLVHFQFHNSLEIINLF